MLYKNKQPRRKYEFKKKRIFVGKVLYTIMLTMTHRIEALLIPWT